MKILKNLKKLLCVLLATCMLFALVGCGQEEPLQDYADSNEGATSSLMASSYADPNLWAFCDLDKTGKDVDVFFVNPTTYLGSMGEYQWKNFNAEEKEKFIGGIMTQKGLYEQNARFFSPYYHQLSLAAYFLPESARMEYFNAAYNEVKGAFEYYLKNFNDGRPIVLAGFSQGSEICMRLLKDEFKDPELMEKLVACFAPGWRFTQEELDANKHIKMAQGENDTQVLVTYEIEDKSIQDSMFVPKGTKTLGINPLNWKTDSTVAPRTLNKGACTVGYDGTISKEEKNFTGAVINPNRGTLNLTDVNLGSVPETIFYDNNKQAFGKFPVGVYHLYDCQFFYRNLQENVQTRIKAYMDKAA